MDLSCFKTKKKINNKPKSISDKHSTACKNIIVSQIAPQNHFAIISDYFRLHNRQINLWMSRVEAEFIVVSKKIGFCNAERTLSLFFHLINGSQLLRNYENLSIELSSIYCLASGMIWNKLAVKWMLSSRALIHRTPPILARSITRGI